MSDQSSPEQLAPIALSPISREEYVSFMERTQGGEAQENKQTFKKSRGKRKQVKKACSNCRKAHSACDKQRPCPRCVARGEEAYCVDLPRKKRKLSDPDIALPEPKIQKQEGRRPRGRPRGSGKKRDSLTAQQQHQAGSATDHDNNTRKFDFQSELSSAFGDPEILATGNTELASDGYLRLLSPQHHRDFTPSRHASSDYSWADGDSSSMSASDTSLPASPRQVPAQRPNAITTQILEEDESGNEYDPNKFDIPNYRGRALLSPPKFESQPREDDPLASLLLAPTPVEDANTTLLEQLFDVGDNFDRELQQVAPDKRNYYYDNTSSNIYANSFASPQYFTPPTTASYWY